MAKGKVWKINYEKGFGFIKPEGGNDNVFFRLDWVRNVPSSGIQEGMFLSFEAESSEKGLRAKRVWFEGGAASSSPQTSAPVSAGYRFLNPYNFVGSLREPQIIKDRVETVLLGRCQPPPHDRWVGLNGTIRCSLEAVTPLFVSDSEHWTDPVKEHGIFQFYKYDFGNGPEPALPASSLRGMFRNEYEAVTNSCFAHFEYDRRLSYHLPAGDALKLMPARVVREGKDNWWLCLLPGTARISIGDRPRDKLYAGRVEQYEAIRYAGKRRPAPVLKKVSLGTLKHGDPCFARVENLDFPPVWNVISLAKTTSELSGSGGRVVEGYLCINNQNIEPKRFERFFFRDPDNKFGPERVHLSEDVRQKYRDLIQDYQLRHRDEVEKCKQKHNPALPWKKGSNLNPGFSRFIIGGPTELRDGDLVYAMLSGNIQSPRVEFVAPVAIPRVSYKRKVDDLLAEHLHKCEDIDRLCPACRLFGWVAGKGENDRQPIEKATAYAGRLRFTHGRLIQPAKEKERTTLSILASPKPTTGRFYLRPATGKPHHGQDDILSGYDNRENVLRGRKFYRHHGHTGDQKYWADSEAREYRGRGEASDQNRTLVDALLPGAIFKFEIQFENLAPSELGALLWVLKLDHKGYHRLGYAKPLGFGSMKVSQLDVDIIDMAERYQPEFRQSQNPLSLQDQTNYESLFKEGMATAYQQEFDKIPLIFEILTLLGEPKLTLPIHYPRTDRQPSAEGKNFEWFVGNKRERQLQLTLELPGDEQGLPLIDKYGKVIP